MFKQESSPDKPTKIYTRKELIMMETTIYDSRTSFYIPSIQKLSFHIPHVRIIGTNHCGELRRTAFKRRELFQDILCCRYYDERVVASFDNQIQSEYYGGNISVSIEGIELEHFSAAQHEDINSTTPSHQLHAVFHSFLPDNSKKDAATTTTHSKRLISLLKITMSQCYYIIIDRGTSTPGHEKEVVEGLNDFDKRYIYKLMSKFQLPGSVRFDSQIKMHTGTKRKLQV